MYKVTFYFLIVLFFSLNISAAAAHKISSRGYALLLLGNDRLAAESGWTNHADLKQLINYGKSRNMNLVDDAPPVANQKASFIAAPGVSFMVSGFEPQKTYYMWIDFVRFTYDTNPGIYSKLMIFVDGRQVDEITWGDIDTDSLYKVELPLDLSYDGDVSITMKEKSMNYGYWGIWDIIIGSGDLPQGAFFKEDIDEMTTVTDVETKMSERDTTTKRDTVSQQRADDVKKSDSQSAQPKKSDSKPEKKKRAPVQKKPAQRKTQPKQQTTDEKSEPDIPVIDEPAEPLVDDVTVDSPEMPEEPEAR